MQNMLMPQPAPDGQAAQAPPQVSPEQIADARNHMKVVSMGLADLAERPQGSLSKRDVFNALGEMIAQGAFSTPQAKQQLVAQMAQVPDDERAIRQMIGQHLLQMGVMQDHFAQNYPEEAANA